MSPRRRGGRIQPTDDWEQLELLCAWPEQVRYEESRPMVLFGVSAAERSRQTRSASERTLYRRTERFDEEGIESLFSSEAAKRIPVLRCCEEGKPLMRRGRKAQGPPY